MDFLEIDPKPREREPNTIFREELRTTDYLWTTDFSLERINQLFQNGNITANEHSALIGKFYPVEKKVSVFALLSLITASINWILMLKFTYHDDVYTLLSAGNKYYISLFLVPLSLLLFAFAIHEINRKENVKGFGIAIAGLTLALAILSITIPTFLMNNLG
jgi:hypothetical protein